MLPANGFIHTDFSIADQPSNTFYLDVGRNRVQGSVDGLEAMRQAIYLTLETERYRHVIFSWNYGAELLDLFGQPAAYAILEIERRVTEALLQDPRITGCGDFVFQIDKKVIHVSFTASTVFGDVPVEKAVIV